MTINSININENFDIKKYGNRLYQHFLKQIDLLQGQGKKFHARVSPYTVNNINTIACLMVARDTYEQKHFSLSIQNALPSALQRNGKFTRLLLAKIRQMKKLGLVEASKGTSIIALTELGDQILDDYYQAVGVTQEHSKLQKAMLFTYIRETFNTTGIDTIHLLQPHTASFVAVRSFCNYRINLQYMFTGRSLEYRTYATGAIGSIAWILWNISFIDNESFTSIAVLNN